VPAAPAHGLPPSPETATRVPSCVLVGRQLHNFALYDLNGQPWEFRQRRGRLVLLDFWGSWCLYCVQAIPHLNGLQQQFGPRGLEVIGIAYEDGMPQERVHKVERVCRARQVNYRVLMGGDRTTCPVRTQFAVSAWPTLVLLDEEGQILWRGEGLNSQQIQELELLIRRRLSGR
jgi:thiol-disulfide isomerase/thioredoxin